MWSFLSSAGADYIPVLDEVLTFTPTGGTSVCVNITIIDDLDIELNEDFGVSISLPPSPGVFISIPVASVVIISDDSEY